MKDVLRQLTDADREKQRERQNKPSKIAHELTVALKTVGSVQAREDLFVDQLKQSFERCGQERAAGQQPVFSIDTITCPLYVFDPTKPVGDFNAVTGVMESLDEATRYRDKFDRYLTTLAQAKEYLQTKGVNVKARVYFGDAGIINSQAIKNQFGAQSDQELRLCLGGNASTYEVYLQKMKKEFGLDDVDFSFANVTDVVPVLKDLPIDLHQSVETAGLPSGTEVLSMEAKLMSVGVNSDVSRRVINEAEELVRKRGGIYGQQETRRRIYKEVMGFLLAYGLAGKYIQEAVRPDIFVSLDPPGNYRNDLYYSYFTGKGQGMAIFTPHSVGNGKQIESFVARNGEK